MAVAISGIGMVSSVARNAIHSCAAIRAGLSRPHPIEYFELVDPITLDPIPLIGHPIRGYTEGFNLVGLWMRVAKGAMSDLMTALPDDPYRSRDFWNKTAVIAVAPYIDDDRFLSRGDEKPDILKDAYLRRLCDSLDLRIPEESRFAVCKGHAGTTEAVLMAESILQEGRARSVLVMAVDSYLDMLTLEWLASNDRLKSPENPVGLMPGEAGACLLIESPEDSLSTMATFLGGAMEQEAAKSGSDQANVGRGLSTAAIRALSLANVRQFHGDIISDQNGEDWRAHEFAGVRLLARRQISRSAPTVLPAISLGDVGAASGAVAMCVAARAFARSYSASEYALILSSTERGDVAAACLQAA